MNVTWERRVIDTRKGQFEICGLVCGDWMLHDSNAAGLFSSYTSGLNLTHLPSGRGWSISEDDRTFDAMVQLLLEIGAVETPEKEMAVEATAESDAARRVDEWRKHCARIGEKYLPKFKEYRERLQEGGTQ